MTAVVPPPPIAGVGISGENFSFTVTGAIPNSTVTILSSPDLINWLPVRTAVIDATGNASVSIPIGVAEKQFFTLQPL